jgi:hypothetical protein
MKHLILILFLFSIINNLNSQNIYEPFKILDNQITLDGVLNNEEWKNATVVPLNYETEPGNNIKPIVKTTGYILYSEKFIYVGFRAESKEAIRASIRKRDDDGFWNDDVVGINLDTYGDARNNIFLGSNAYGSQFDIRMLNTIDEEKRYDTAFDIEYESTGTISGNSFFVEIKIPFSSIPFPNGNNQKWKFHLFRKYRDYMIQNSKNDRDDPCVTCQNKDEVIFNNITIDKKIELLPYISSNISGTSDSGEEKLNYQKLKTDVGIGINVELSKNLSLELTINPDFSQIEADVTKIDANSSYSLSYPEKRPFFNKGTDILKLNSEDLQPFYSRSINDPIFAAKLLNQGKKSRFFLLSSMDNNSPYLIAGNDRSYFGEGGKSLVNVFRYQRLFKNGSKLGMISTSRYYEGGGYGNLFGFDGLFQITKNIRFSFDLIKNYNLEPNTNWIDSNDSFSEYSVKLNGEKFNGSAMYLGFLRSTENWRTYLGYKYIDPEYRADVGFVVKNDRKWLTFYQGYEKYNDKNFVKKTFYGIQSDILYNFNNQLEVVSIDGIFRAELKGNTYLTYTYDFDVFKRYLDNKFKSFGTNKIFIRSNPIELISFNSMLNFGRDIAYNSDNPKVGKEIVFFTNITLQLNNNFSISNSINFSRLKNIENNDFYFKGYVYRLNTKYQFNKFLGIRLTSEFNNFNDSFFIQPLFEWNPNPFTIFYVGGNQNFLNNDENYFLNNSQFFIKFQYLISL